MQIIISISVLVQIFYIDSYPAYKESLMLRFFLIKSIRATDFWVPDDKCDENGFKKYINTTIIPTG